MACASSATVEWVPSLQCKLCPITRAQSYGLTTRSTVVCLCVRGKGSTERYFANDTNIKVAQGVSGALVDKGSIMRFLPYLVQGVRHGLQDAGTSSVAQMQQRM